MAEIEHPEKYNWWLNELVSLGISTLEKNGLNNRQESSDLTDAVKQTLIVKDSDLSDAFTQTRISYCGEFEDKENPIFARSCPYQD